MSQNTNIPYDVGACADAFFALHHGLPRQGPGSDATTRQLLAEETKATPAGNVELNNTLENGTHAMTTWTVRPETETDIAAVRDIVLAAFDTAEEAAIVDRLRADPGAWIDGLSIVAVAPDGTVVGHVLYTRCHVDGQPALALAPVSVLPAFQKTGAGSAVIRAGLEAARAQGENLVLVLGHPDYYPRFGFTPASGFGVRAPFEVPDEAMMALTLNPDVPTPTGTIEYPPAFGI